MQGRGKSRGLEVTPGPGTYSPEKVAPMRQRTPPAFSLGPRLCPPLPASPAPAPNAYTLPPLWGSQVFTKPCSPSFTVGGRSASSRPPQAPTDTPGPGQYECPDPNAYRPRPPAFSMQGRTRAPPSPGRTPGPAAPPGHPCAPSPERGAAPAPAGGGLRRRGQRTPFPG
ncbi:protein CIMAP1D [Erinaceus europaeus]|uniref:Protein CIMAP1D n=1 Tax=Erinaceus europaeus TaxID=9365 RepID=A0A1S2ZUV9_ERIEU|nr:protein CIMAP1D [Erinaceus europaeus]